MAYVYASFNNLQRTIVAAHNTNGTVLEVLEDRLCMHAALVNSDQSCMHNLINSVLHALSVF